ncbi:PilW family protein [Pseudomonas sp. CC120222-01a]|uniref:PilW family protein n=1 Tax=Pseudomonas sp. CC120222-01a TaxID=1378075 RepID=UPI000D878553|nr:prepilin-type N-terminal cleavage/methylation domain-containing protein [Pseudomonas sp. CC120222-01a]PVZ29723.1 type IV pilus assembly protein PilW [Pseudomonas sp. CC120222-01a]
MKRGQGGFGLLEVTLALAIGLIVLAAASQLFVSVHQTWRLQDAGLRLQDDARLALLRLAQDIRMAGMFGCLRLASEDFKDPIARQAFAQPIQLNPSRLDLIVAELPGYPGAPDWTVLTDCKEKAKVGDGHATSSDYPFAYPISQHSYRFSDNTLSFKRNNKSKFQPLVDHVREWRVERLGDRVDLALVLYEPTLRLEQRHELSVALRNPVSEP